MGPLHEGNALADCLTKINFLLQRKLKIIMLCIIKMLRCLGFSFTFPVTLFMPLLKAHDLSNLLALFTSWSKSSGFFFPKGLQQMDVTHIPCFEKGAFVHLSVDTCSYVIWASARTREVAKDVLQHLFASFDRYGLCYQNRKCTSIFS